MKLMVNHQTHYHYSEWSLNSVQYIKMTPQSSAHQQVLDWNIQVPGVSVTKRDAFDNIWISSQQRYAYQQLSIMAQGTIVINPDAEIGVASRIQPQIFLQPTMLTQCNAVMLEFARHYVTQRSRNCLIELAQALLAHIPYVPNITTVHTSAIDAFMHRQGVCQDHSHVFIAMCRALGLPARYVSGYLYVPETLHLASHAWAEVFLDHSWYCFDVSNQLFTPGSHIYVALGRDYFDVAPIRGVREKGGIEQMDSTVQVLRC